MLGLVQSALGRREDEFSASSFFVLRKDFISVVEGRLETVFRAWGDGRVGSIRFSGD